MPDHRAKQEESGQHPWLSMACNLIATWTVVGLSVLAGIAMTPEALRVVLARWRPGARRV
jgi:hypothetical protein